MFNIINRVPSNYLREYIIDSVGANNKFNDDNNCIVDTFYCLNEFFNNKKINYNNSKIDIRNLPFEYVDDKRDCRVTYKEGNIKNIFILDGNSIESECVLAHEIGHVYIHQCSKNNKDYLNKETIPVFLEFYISYKNSIDQYLLLRNKKIKYSLSLLIGDYRWFRNGQKLNYIYGFVQADLLFKKYLDNPSLTGNILNEIVNDEIPMEEGLNILECNLNNNNKSVSFNKKRILTQVNKKC